MKYAVYPPIGIARLGNSPDKFFIGSEQSDSLGVEIQADGSESPVTDFKDRNYRMKRQASRFHIFEIPDNAPPRPANLPNGATVKWKVHLVNKKDAVYRDNLPPQNPQTVRINPARNNHVISAVGEVEGAEIEDPVVLEGSYESHLVRLGHILTDTQQRLVVLGGSGRSESPFDPPASIADFYTNPDWFDDVADGPVTATISIPQQPPIEATPAWVITAPPDFAPSTLGVVTLYDVMYQLALNSGWISADALYFDSDIRPIIQRAAGLRHVSGISVWPQISQDWDRLGNSNASERRLRSRTANLVKQVETSLMAFSLMDWMKVALDKWVAGNFSSGIRPNISPSEKLTRSALDGTVGQGFFPGIEGGINLTDPSIYLSDPFDFRLDPRMIEAGDVTALMALPWQADFLKCAGAWWPAQRPDYAPQASGPERPWVRPSMTHQQLVDNVMKLGVISETPSGIVEQGRHPSLEN